MTTIYRIENVHGRGFYNAGGFKLAGVSGNETRHQPAPKNDPKLKPYFGRGFFGGWEAIADPAAEWSDNHVLRFGFHTIRQLKNWLNNGVWCEKLDHAGYVVSVYDAKDRILGKTQAIFNIRTAKKIGTERLISLPDKKAAA